MQSTVFQRAWLTACVALALAIGAGLRYPGGTPLNPATVGYSMPQNFLSDLGMTVAYNGQPNRMGAAFFVGSLFVLVVGLGSCLLAIVRLQWSDVASRRWARAATACALLACAGFVGVAFTPENRVMALHVSFTFWAWRFVSLGAGLMAVAAFRSVVFPRRVALIWTVVTILLASYVALITWGPRVATPSGLLVQVVAQKAATVILVLAIVYLARATGARRVGATI
jgi:hypothetical membrane protein